ncbi:vanomycin resistance protein VanB [Xylanimonas oleitrophica]|uniref:Vanomycin resistance protein VanB n=1 Tax=Xylanimonas oleitrophica TaxID=2607479 RepID=A0A2W5WUW9_9MICO|nr:VanW family protein [Xylanimonas oleitrophica]PZR55077.1 vanomycin resistance protein VanB [Xylanimonas oleitrophica]
MGHPTERGNAPEPTTAAGPDAGSTADDAVPEPSTPAQTSSVPPDADEARPGSAAPESADGPAASGSADGPAASGSADGPAAPEDDGDEAPAPAQETSPAPSAPSEPSAAAQDDDETPYVPPVKAYERPEEPAVPTAQYSEGEPTMALPAVVGTIAGPAAGPAASAAQGAGRGKDAPPAAVPPAQAGLGTAPGVPAGASGPGAPPADPLSGLVGDGQPSRAPKALLWAGVAVIVLAGVYAGAQWAFADRVPTGTHVAGIDLGGLSRDEAVSQLEAGLGPRAAEPVEVVAGEASTTLDPASAGLRFDAAGTVDGLTGFSLSPGRLWAHLTGGADTDPVVRVDGARLDATVEQLVDGLATEPVDGTVAFTDGEAVATPAQDGTRVEAEGATAVLREKWLVEQGPYELPTEAVAPEITQAKTDAALEQARTMISAPVVVQVGDQRPELPPQTLAALASFEPSGGELAPVLDADKLVTAVVDRTRNLLTEPDDAHFEFVNGTPQIVGGKPGTTLDPAALAEAVRTAALGTERTASVELVERDPEHTREGLEKLGIKEVVSSFSTPLTSEPVRTRNLVRGAQLVNGTLIEPGATFSLLDTLSPITVANGYYAAGVVSNGLHTEGVGGGLSQMATTTYNAGFFAGFEDVEHRQHSYWFSRYPAGREATIYVGSIDMRFKNDTPYGALMQSWVADGRLHVQIWSTKYYEVKERSGEKRNIVPATVVTKSGPGCESYPKGNDGFAISYFRQVFLEGRMVKDETYSWTYKPDNGIVCAAPEPTGPPPAEGAPAPADG